MKDFKAKEAGERMKQRRLDVGKTRSQIADEIGVTVDTIGRYERGELQPAAGRRPLLAKALDLGLFSHIYYSDQSNDSAQVSALGKVKG